jgi:DNA-directed RNA polymerase specialized sigma24 family protein
VEVAVEGLSYADVVTAYAPALLRLAVMLTGSRDDAEDLLQSAFLRASRHGDRIAEMAAPAAYLRTVLVHEHLSAGRRSVRRPRTPRSQSGWVRQLRRTLTVAEA